MRAIELLMTMTGVTHIGKVGNCTNPRRRLEWRELDLVDRQGYTNAVLCLTTKPSRLGLNSTLYDDFGYIHDWFGLHS
jgi:tyrosinase